MQLTLYSDYSLRILLYLSREKNSLRTINEIATFYHISKNHLVKVVHQLVKLGFITSTQGKGGGIKLAKKPDEISIGAVVRQTESHFQIAECFNASTNRCAITDVCRIKGILNQSLEAFYQVLDTHTLAEGIDDV